MIDPVALQIGPLAIRWYGISYAVGFIFVLWFLTHFNKSRKVFANRDQIFDLCFWIFLVGVIGGGRLGYILFYNLPYYLANPIKLLSVWEGGMSFHGGLIGTILVIVWFARKHKLNLLRVMDFVAVPGAMANSAGRLANFVNRELYGRPVESPNWEWLGVDFGDGILRYPSQLFQAMEGIAAFALLFFIFIKYPKAKPGTLLFSFFALLGTLRFITEFWRAPDAQIGYILGFLTMGQILSLLVAAVGFAGLLLIRRR